MTGTILDEIIRNKYECVERSKLTAALSTVQREAALAQPTRDFKSALLGSGIKLIAEVKRASPSKGLLRKSLDPITFATCYEENGAAAISVLTNQKYFQGSLDDLRVVREGVSIPVLRKDFIFDTYQVYEARAAGADAVLLIAAILPDEVMAELYSLIQHLGMDALIEVHNVEELNRVMNLSPQIVGINNRDLRTFTVSLETTANLVSHIPGEVVKVAESGIHFPQDVERLRLLGVDAMLVGESIVTAPDVAFKVRQLIAFGEETSDEN